MPGLPDGLLFTGTRRTDPDVGPRGRPDSDHTPTAHHWRPLDEIRRCPDPTRRARTEGVLMAIDGIARVRTTGRLHHRTTATQDGRARPDDTPPQPR